MKLPAKIEYAAKAVLQLALHYDRDRPVTLDQISGPDSIPKKFLIQLLLRLKSAGIVASTRGVSGGYYLAKPPAEITLADVFRAVDTHVLSGASRAKYLRQMAGIPPKNPILDIWNSINDEVIKKLNVNFEELKTRAQSTELVYSI
jgi:Rrf2 family protein